MGKKTDEAATEDVPSTAEVEGLRSKTALMEEAMQKQALDFISELVFSQARLQSDIKDQLDDFFTTFMKL
jgi:hypothetical protein